MPFVAKTGQNRWQKKVAAFHLPARLENLLGRIPHQRELYWGTEKPSMAQQPTNMGRHSQKPTTGMQTKSQDIGALLQRQAQPKMAAPENQELLADPQAQALNNPPAHTPPQAARAPITGLPDLSALASKQDIKNYLTEFRQMLATDIAVIQADLQMVTDRVRASEEDIIEIRITSAEEVPTLLRALGLTAPYEEPRDQRTTPTWDPATVVAFTPQTHSATGIVTRLGWTGLPTPVHTSPPPGDRRVGIGPCAHHNPLPPQAPWLGALQTKLTLPFATATPLLSKPQNHQSHPRQEAPTDCHTHRPLHTHNHTTTD
ncbi:Hypothetical predicted protein [Pelobates cultripes]|uniref:Uncharacterized protein n=1 Tax=Pelobates cultripes TaxID=61616 RepID=A0AAD1S8T2_PELCU|nr:Hypothetical predicted protein [Pelobates cultripes]